VDPTSSNSSTAADQRRGSSQDTDLGELVNYVVAYAKQETLGPLKGAGRWLALGTAAAFALGIGLLLVLLGALRLLQTEWDWAAEGSWTWLAYVIVLALCVGVIGLAVSRIKRETLNKEPY
jgi:cytochrome c biogenesis protein CcdA